MLIFVPIIILLVSLIVLFSVYVSVYVTVSVSLTYVSDTFSFRNAKEKRKNKKHFLKQSEVDDLKSASARLSLDLNSILCSELLGKIIF